jgi:hypothetical protein
MAWLVKAVVDGLLGLGLGLLLIPFSAWVIAPVAGLFTRKA